VSKISVMGDLHAAKHREFNFNNGRLTEAIKVLGWWFRESHERGANIGVFVGDLFHNRGLIDVEVFTEVYETIRACMDGPDRFERLFLLVGNHDQATKDGAIHSLKPFRAIQGVTVVDWPMDTHTGMAFVPYYDRIEELRANMAEMCEGRKHRTTLFLHSGIDGAMVGPNDYVMKDALKPEDLEGWKTVYSGHYHNHQAMLFTTNGVSMSVVIPGSPLQTNRGERTGLHGFVIIDKDHSMQFVENDFSPKFVETDFYEWCKNPNPYADEWAKNYVTLTVDTDIQAGSVLTQYGGKCPPWLVIKRAQDEGQIDAQAIEVKLDDDDGDLIKRYAENASRPEAVASGLGYLHGERITE